MGKRGEGEEAREKQVKVRADQSHKIHDATVNVWGRLCVHSVVEDAMWALHLTILRLCMDGMGRIDEDF